MISDSKDALRSTLEEYLRAYTQLLFNNLQHWQTTKSSRQNSSTRKKRKSTPTQDILQEVFFQMPSINYGY